jgi:O-antigen/teichoic acid export membrane protein
MANIKSLVKDTAIYGISSIAGRFVNYLLVPIQTAAWAASGGEYGIVTNIFAYVALLMVILTYGMETTFFRYANKGEHDPNTVYTTTLIAVGSTSTLFAVLTLIFLKPITQFMGYADHPSWVAIMLICVALDAFQCIPFAYLRYKKRPVKFALIQLTNIFLNVILNIIYLFVLPALHINPFGLYDEHFTLDVGMVFYINFSTSVFITVLFWPELFRVKYKFDGKLLRSMLRYSWPLLILGIAGILNQTFDKIAFPFLYPGTDAKAQLGIYGATVKIAMIMAMITQAFRYAYEPFVFGKAKDKDNRETYAKTMKYFIIFTLLAFLMVMGYMDILRYIIRNHDYWAGLRVVPIVMAAEIMMGVYFNLSFWYKLTDRTIWGAYFSGIGCAVLILINVIFVPRFSYMACAWGGVAGYGTAMLLSYFVGQRYYPINYPVKSILAYVLLALVLTVGMVAANKYLAMVPALLVNTLLVTVFLAYLIKQDLPLSSLPIIGKKFRKS